MNEIQENLVKYRLKGSSEGPEAVAVKALEGATETPLSKAAADPCGNPS